MVNPSTRITSSIVRLQPLYGVGKAQRILADQGMTMMVVTHEMAFAREVADRVIFIDGAISSSRDRHAKPWVHPSTSARRIFCAASRIRSSDSVPLPAL